VISSESGNANRVSCGGDDGDVLDQRSSPRLWRCRTSGGVAGRRAAAGRCWGSLAASSCVRTVAVVVLRRALAAGIAVAGRRQACIVGLEVGCRLSLACCVHAAQVWARSELVVFEDSCLEADMEEVRPFVAADIRSEVGCSSAAVAD
jgi:hypothetical protein